MRITIEVRPLAIYKHEGETEREFRKRRALLLRNYIEQALNADHRFKTISVDMPKSQLGE